MGKTASNGKSEFAGSIKSMSDRNLCCSPYAIKQNQLSAAKFVGLLFSRLLSDYSGNSQIGTTLCLVKFQIQ